MDIDQIELIGGHPALDFINTVEGRGSGTLLNYLADFETLAHWCGRVGLLSPDVLRAALRDASSNPRTANRAWRDAMDLREALNGIFRASVRGERPSAQSLTRFDRSLESALGRRHLKPMDSGAWLWDWREDDQLLLLPGFEIALLAAGLLTDEKSRGRIKACANGPCDWMFLDTSRNGQRRWCRMAVCGNVSKVRRFRQRRRSTQ